MRKRKTKHYALAGVCRQCGDLAQGGGTLRWLLSDLRLTAGGQGLSSLLTLWWVQHREKSSGLVKAGLHLPA